MITHTWRHLRRHWRLNLGVLLCMTLASALLAGFSSYSHAVAAQELSQTLEEVRPSERNLLITGTRYTFSEALFGRLQELLGETLKDRLIVRRAISPADPQPSLEGSDKQIVALLDLYSFNQLTDRVRLVEGRLPNQVRLNEATESWRPPPIEAVIGVDAADQSSFGVGDRLTGSKTYHRLDIVGIVEPLDPHDDLWGEDLSAFEVSGDADPMALPLIIAAASMQSNYPERPIFFHEVSWRVALDHRLIKVDQVETLRSDLINFQTQSATVDATVSTGLVQLLADYLARLSRVRMTLFLLTAQALIFVLYTLTMFTSVIVDLSQLELATLSGRGASPWQITRSFALENLILALPAALLFGPGLALIGISGWSRSTGDVLPVALPGEAWLLSGAVAGLGWLALVSPIWLSARRNIPGQRSMGERPSQLSAVQARYVDLYLLAFGALLTWQLNRAGSVVMRRLGETQLADPLLLIGPSLLLIAAAMTFLRIVPLLLRPFARLAQRQRGLILPLGLNRLARDPAHLGRVVLLVSLTAGLVLFARSFEDSLAVDPAGHEGLIRRSTPDDRVLDDAQAHLRALRSDALARGTSGALRLNAVTLGLFSLTAYILVNLVAAQERALELGVLRAMGLSIRQLMTLVIIEGMPALLFGLAAGVIVGIGLSAIMIPYLSQALAGLMTGVAGEAIQVDWEAAGRLYALLMGAYGLALLLVVLILGQMRTLWLPWRGDE